MKVNCIRCKGRGHCGRAFCPIYEKSKAIFSVQKALPEKSFQGASPAPFVGSHNYPDVNLGILSPGENAEDSWKYDAPKHWAAEGFDIRSIIGLRSSLINTREKSNVHIRDRLRELAQDVAMALTPPEVEFEIARKPVFSLNLDPYNAPLGPIAELKKADLAENPKVNREIEKKVYDTDLLSKDAITELYGHGIDENAITKVLSVGALGLEKRRKLVPTRWSITAVDDQIGKDILKDLRDNREADTQAFFGGILGNYYLIMLLPDIWSYELFEIYMPKAGWNQSEDIDYSTDHEGFKGRTSYAENCAGGYYAARLPVLEKLKSMKRQAGVVVIRTITGEYAAPLGVWVCREAVRKALKSNPIQFASVDLMLEYARKVIRKRFGYDAGRILEKSIVLKERKHQRRLQSFI